MPTPKSNNNASLWIFIVFVLICIGLLFTQVFKGFNIPGSNNSGRDSLEISVAHAPELEEILTFAKTEFEKQQNQGNNPVTGQKLKADDKLINLKLESVSSGEARTKLVNNINKPDNQDNFKPSIFAPSVSSWLNLVNYETGQTVFRDDFSSVAKSPVGIAIWESKLNLLKAKYGNDFGFNEIYNLSQDPNGWQSLNNNSGKKNIYYGMTNPQISSTAISSLISQYQASSQKNNQASEQLTLSTVKDTKIESGVRDLQKMIRQYSSNTVIFREYIGRGPDYIDMLPLAENDLIFINSGKGSSRPPEKMVMLYPKDGSIIHDYPMAVPEAKWLNEEQKAAAKNFITYLQTENIQKKFLENGFRPTNSNVGLNTPISEEFGVNPSQPTKILKQPSGEVISTIQTNWDFVKKQSEVLLLVDTSGSMDGEKMANARKALATFADNFPQKSSIGLTNFDNKVSNKLPIKPLESSQNQIKGSINELNASGSTALFDGLLEAIKIFESDAASTNAPTTGQDPNTTTNPTTTKTDDNSSIRAIVLLSDGGDTASTASLRQVTDKLQTSQNSNNPIIVIPIAYGKDADMNVLNSIARSSKTTVQSGDTKDIDKLLKDIVSYF